MDDIKVSVIVLSYNHEKYVRQTIESIVSQKTDFRYELIIHDDASTDGTADIIREYAEKYPDIIKAILQPENIYSKGEYPTDYMLPLVRGKYIACCESDDYWCDDTKLQRQADILDAHPEYVACVHQTEELNCRTGEKRYVARVTGDGELSMEYIIGGGGRAYHTSSVLIRKENFTDPAMKKFTSFIDGVEDYQESVFLRLNGGIYFIDRVMSVYRRFSTKDAWSSIMDSDRENVAKLDDQWAEFLEYVDEYSGGKYHEPIAECIRKRRYDSLMNRNSKEIFLNKDYRELFSKESTYMKCLLIAKAYMPSGLWNALKSLKGSRK